MYCGYWNCHNKIKGDYSAVKNGERYDLDIYLHGLCDIFAAELAGKMQEQDIPLEICIIVNEEGLVHCFLWIESPEEDIDYYIDVRGITSDADEFFDEFADFFDYHSWEQGEDCGEEDILFFYDIDTFQQKVHELTGFEPSFFKEETEDAKKIIDEFREYYILPDEILNEIREED